MDTDLENFYIQSDGIYTLDSQGVTKLSPLLSALLPTRKGERGVDEPDTRILLYIQNLVCMRTREEAGKLIPAIIGRATQDLSDKNAAIKPIDARNGYDTANAQLYALEHVQRMVQKVLDQLVKQNCLNDGSWVDENTFSGLRRLVGVGQESVLSNLVRQDSGSSMKAYRIRWSPNMPADTNPLASLQKKEAIEIFLNDNIPSRQPKPTYTYTEGLQRPWAVMPKPTDDDEKRYFKDETYFEKERDAILVYIQTIIDNIEEKVRELTMLRERLTQSMPESVLTD